MSIKGTLTTDEGMRNLDRILTTLFSADESFNDALIELTLFFIRHIKTNLLPISSTTEFPSPIQKQVYSWLDTKYTQFCDYLNETPDFPLTEGVSNSISSILAVDPSKKLIPAAANSFIRKNIFADDHTVTNLPEFQNTVYTKLLGHVSENRDAVFKLLTTEFPHPVPFNSFSSLFLEYVSLSLTETETIQIFEKFDSILSRVEDKLVTYDFLHEQFGKPSAILASLSLPYLVTVASSRAVDSPKFYQIAFKSITPQSLSSPHRNKFLDTLIRVLCPKTRPAAESSAFSVKLSRMLPLIPVDAQLDVLSVLQHLVRAHECVAELLEPRDGPISNVDSELEECLPQTLWEVRALKSCQTVVVAEQAKTLGQRWVPPEFCSFKLAEAVEACKARPKESAQVGNWASGLDQAIWSFH